MAKKESNLMVTLPKIIASNKKLTPVDKLLFQRFNGLAVSQKSNVVFYSNNTAVADYGLTVKGFQKSIKHLEELGLIKTFFEYKNKLKIRHIQILDIEQSSIEQSSIEQSSIEQNSIEQSSIKGRTEFHHGVEQSSIDSRTEFYPYKEEKEKEKDIYKKSSNDLNADKNFKNSDPQLPGNSENLPGAFSDIGEDKDFSFGSESQSPAPYKYESSKTIEGYKPAKSNQPEQDVPWHLRTDPDDYPF